MELKPQAALDALVNILQRVAFSPAESIGASHCIEVIRERLDAADKINAPVETAKDPNGRTHQ